MMRYLKNLFCHSAAIALAFVCLSGLATTNTISIKDSSYAPNQMAIYPGDTVTWIQDDNTEHSVTSSDQIFNSGTLVPGDTWSYTFNDIGTFPYFCVFHGAGNMAGVISVSEPAPNAAPEMPLNVFPVNKTTNQPVAVHLGSGQFSDSDEADFHAASQWIIRYANNQEVAVDSGMVTGGSLTNYSPNGLIEETTYDWQVRYKDGRGSWSAYSAPTRFTTLVSFNEPGSGLTGSYYSTADFTSPPIVVTNAMIQFDWAKTRPHRRITVDNFSVRWEGAVLPKYSELYQFEFEFRGGARVWVNNLLLIDDLSCSFIQTRRSPITLVAGQLVPVKIEYVADPQGALAILRWMSPNVPTEVIPTVRMFPHQP